jgi:hypothetical protein
VIRSELKPRRQVEEDDESLPGPAWQLVHKIFPVGGKTVNQAEYRQRLYPARARR